MEDTKKGNWIMFLGYVMRKEGLLQYTTFMLMIVLGKTLYVPFGITRPRIELAVLG